MTKKLLHTMVSNLKECFDGEPWYGVSVMARLKAIDWRIVNEKKFGAKSIATLLGHMIGWRVFVLKKLQGDRAFTIQIDGPTDWPEIHITTAEEWGELLGKLQATQDELLKIISEQSDELLDQTVPGKNFNFRFLLEGITQHDIYHLGQITLLKTQYGQ